MLNYFYIDIRYYFALICLFATLACNDNKLKERHPQAKMGSGASAHLDETSINEYADSIQLHLSEYEKRESLVFNKEDYSFHITRYSANGKPVLYIEQGDGDIGSVKKYYYVDGQELLLLKNDVFNSFQSPRYSSTREYFRNNVHFYADSKSADNDAAFKAGKYEKIDEAPNKDAKEVLNFLEDALKLEGEFDLKFEGITEYPKARYIILSRNELKSYRAVIRVETEDDFIQELVSNTEKYKGASLNVRFEVKDGEAFYVDGKVR